MHRLVEITRALDAVEYELRRLDLWHDGPPAPEAFLSTVPFALDTMELHQWLRWIFLARMRALVDAGGPMPSGCAVAPMAEEFYKHGGRNVTGLVACLRQLDRLLQ